MIKFPYKKNSLGEHFPIIDLFAYNSKYVSRVACLVDSGATISIFRLEVAQSLRIDIMTGKQIYLGGVGGRIKGYIHSLTLEIGDKKIAAPVVFSHEYNVSFNLLGRQAIFESFKIIFDEKKLLVEFF